MTAPAPSLRDRIAAALREHYLSSDRDVADADGRMPCVCGGWREPGDMDGDEYDWDAHHADVVLPLVAAEREAGRRDGLREGANLIDNDDDCGCGGCDSCLPRADAARLRARADAEDGTR